MTSSTVRRRWGTRLLPLVVTVILVLTTGGLFQGGAARGAETIAPPEPAPDVVVAAGEATVDIPATAVSVDASSRSAVTAFYHDQYVMTEEIDPGWTGNFASCRPGTISLAYKQAVMRRINYFRALAGVPSIAGFSNAYSTKAQAAALMFSRNGQLSHDPPDTWACWTEAAADAAGNSNILKGGLGTLHAWAAVDLYMSDGFSKPVGHRRWVLYPPAQVMGVGHVLDDGTYSNANALWVLGNSGYERPAVRDGFVAWPTKGYNPYQSVPHRWSFSLPGADFSSASVTVKMGSTALPVTIEARGGPNYGDPAFVWGLQDVWDNQYQFLPPSGADTTYTVTLSNVIVGGSPRTFTYDVIVFDPDAGPLVTLDKEKSKYNGWVTATLANFTPNTPVSLRWPRNYEVTSGPNDGQFTTLLAKGVTDGSGAATLRFRTPLEPLGDYTITARDESNRRTTTTLRVIPRIMLNEERGPADTRLRVYFYGFGPGERIEVRWHTTNSTSSSFQVIKQITVADNGRASTLVPIPSGQSPGDHRIVGKVVGVSRSASTTFNLTVGVRAAEEPADGTPTATTTPRRGMPTPTPSAAVEPTEAPSAEPTQPAEPTVAPTETLEPTTAPTETPTLTETPTPTEAPADPGAEPSGDG